jgi:hypothetical protein
LLLPIYGARTLGVVGTSCSTVFHQLVQEHVRFWKEELSHVVIRDKDMIAHSGRYTVREVKWNTEKSKLEVVVVHVGLDRVPMFIWRCVVWILNRNADDKQK